jgi:hypothetical protein
MVCHRWSATGDNKIAIEAKLTAAIELTARFARDGEVLPDIEQSAGLAFCAIPERPGSRTRAI